MVNDAFELFLNIIVYGGAFIAGMAVLFGVFFGVVGIAELFYNKFIKKG